MPSPSDPNPTSGLVVAWLPADGDHGTEHERVTLLAFARRLAALKGFEDGGWYDPASHVHRRLYFVPADTLTGEQAAALGIHGADDLFGGVVPHAFVATKAISHPLVRPGAAAAAGWCPAFADHAGDALLGGYSAFDLADAHAAGLRLLGEGPLRLKPVRASGGRGQSVVRDAAQLESALHAMDESEVRQHGLVLEQDLEDVRTFSIGQVHVGGLTASYIGTQRLTAGADGEDVFGGSDLTVVRGGFEALDGVAMPPEMRRALAQARRYDDAVHACFPGFYASRKNYDVALGREAGGRWRSGVLEQSWRVGGATGPEIAALEVLRREPRRALVRTSGFELFGDSPEPPAGATVYFRGTDPRMGRLTKYTVVNDVDAG